MFDYEKLGVFYLGRPYDMATKKHGEGLVLYDSKDLVTHGVCVGMTGSGKTGLCIDLLEEAAIDNIPAIIIDPKGDMTNLLLTFPNLTPEEFLPWINEDDARKKDMSVEQYAAKQAEIWKNGLTSWGQDNLRIKRLKEAADFIIYTPGSNAGIPVSILKSFGAPSATIIEDSELLRERVSSTTSSLLGLIGITADPIKSREHILISYILTSFWQQGKDLDLANLIHQIQNPSFKQIGVMNLESFFPSKERFELALALNNLLASPSFTTWLEGETLDIGNILYSPSGKPRMSIFYIAHLSDAERMFFVSLLLNQILSWMRAQSGTTSLRAIVYMDEIFGYFPPVANPPSKTPLLTLLKQARAFGVGIMLTTQNPVDLDYKGLSNAGTWFIGRLQTERDKMRVLDGLEGAASTQGTKFDRKQMEQILAGLGNRIFLMNNVHDETHTIFETRWCMSYLRGPLTRSQIKTLMDPLKGSSYSFGTLTTSKISDEKPTRDFYPAQEKQPATQQGSTKPILPSSIKQFYMPHRIANSQSANLTYVPGVLGNAIVNFLDTKTGISISKDLTFITPLTSDIIPVNWDNAKELGISISELTSESDPNAVFTELPQIAINPKSYDVWSKDFSNWLYRTQQIELMKSPAFKQISKPGESERDFRIRLQQSVHEQRDVLLDQLRKKYATKMASLQEKVRRAQQAVDREAEQAKQQQFQTMISVGSTVLSSFLGKKAISMSSMGRATTAARGASRYMKERQDINRAKETLAIYQQQLKELEDEFNAEVNALTSKTDPLTEQFEQIIVRPAKKDITVRLIGLIWLPYYKDATNNLIQAW